MNAKIRRTLAAFVAIALSALLTSCAVQPKTDVGDRHAGIEVHVVGVYEGRLPGGKARGIREDAQGEVTVKVGGSGRVILVFSAYEPVKWKVVSQDVVIDQILLFGYHDQEVEGPTGARVFSNLQTSVGSSRIYAYKKDDRYTKLEQAIREITGQEVDTFQGAYTAGMFYVNWQNL